MAFIMLGMAAAMAGPIPNPVLQIQRETVLGRIEYGFPISCPKGSINTTKMGHTFTGESHKARRNQQINSLSFFPTINR